MICFWLSLRRINHESIFACFRLAEPGGAWPPFARARAQLVHRHAAAGMRATHYAAGLWRWSRPADWNVDLARCSGGLPALPGGRNPGLHGLHVVILSIALRRLYPDAFSEIVGGSIDDPSATGACGLG